MIVEVNISLLLDKIDRKIKELQLVKKGVFLHQFYKFGYKKGDKRPGLFNKGVFFEDETESEFVSRFWFTFGGKFEDVQRKITEIEKDIEFYRKKIIFLEKVRNQTGSQTVSLLREEVEKLL